MEVTYLTWTEDNLLRLVLAARFRMMHAQPLGPLAIVVADGQSSAAGTGDGRTGCGGPPVASVLHPAGRTELDQIPDREGQLEIVMAGETIDDVDVAHKPRVLRSGDYVSKTCNCTPSLAFISTSQLR